MHHKYYPMLLACLLGVLCYSISIPVYSQTYELSTRDATLTIDKARVLTITSKAAPDIIVLSNGQ